MWATMQKLRMRSSDDMRLGLERKAATPHWVAI